MVVFKKKSLFSGKLVVFGQNGCNRAKVLDFWQKWLYWGCMVVCSKGGCIWAKVIVLVQR